LKCIDRIIKSSSQKGDLVTDYFSHSGATLLSAEYLGRNCFTIDLDPIFCEITIRRLELFRQTGCLGWQNSHPFEDVFACSRESVKKHKDHLVGIQPTLF